MLLLRARRKTFLCPLFGLAVGLTISYILISGSARATRIETSSAFDLSDPRLVYGYAHFVAVGRIEQVLDVAAGSDDKDDTTLYSVRVLRQLKGSLPETVTVSQLGFRDGEHVFATEEQALLRVDKTYILALTAPASATSKTLTLLSGSVSGQLFNPSSEAAMEEAHQYVDEGEWPNEFSSPGAQLLHEQRGISWALIHDEPIRAVTKDVPEATLLEPDPMEALPG